MIRTTQALSMGIAGLVLGATLSVATHVFAGGDKNRLGDEDITEGYVLCERDGVQSVTITEDGITAVIDCSDVPGPDAQE
jgi:hypothetical protein